MHWVSKTMTAASFISAAFLYVWREFSLKLNCSD